MERYEKDSHLGYLFYGKIFLQIFFFFIDKVYIVHYNKIIKVVIGKAIIATLKAIIPLKCKEEQNMLEKKLNEMRNITAKSELIKGLEECGFSVFSDPDTEHGWFDDGLNDTVVKIIPHSSTVIPLDWYLEGKGRKNVLSEKVINNILDSIEYDFKQFLREKKFIKKMYKILFDKDYEIKIDEKATLEEKLNALNIGIESVDDDFIKMLEGIGIDQLEYNEDKTFCTYYSPEERDNEQTSCFDGYTIYYFNRNTNRNSTVYECMKELARLYNTADCEITIEALK